MRKLYLISGVIGLAALGLTGCSHDDLPKQAEVVDHDQTRYLAVAISSPTNYMTRAEGDNFEYGTAEENKVNSLYFVFYDADGKVVSYKNMNGTGSNPTDNATNNNVARFWTSVVPIEMTRGQKVPQYVMCFVNPVEIADLTTKTLTDLDLETRSAVKTGNGFAMSNSVYYGFNPVTGQNHVRVMATPILEGKLFSTEQEAENALKTDAILDIYVERYAAKINLTMTPDALGEGYPVKLINEDGTFKESKITFTPEYWRPNAVDRTTYVTKAFATSPNADGSVTNVNATYAAVNEAFLNTGMSGEGLTGWNDPTNFRSYWGCSPSYYANAYPECSDNITDQGARPYDLKYFRYNELENGVNTAGQTVGDPAIKWDNDKGFTGAFYSRETTASIANIHGGTADNPVNSKAVVASAVIVGNYAINPEDKSADADPEGTFYLYGKNQGVDICYQNLSSVKNAMIGNQAVLFTDIEGTDPVTDAQYFVVKHPAQEVRANYNNAVSGRLVTLQLTAETLAEKDAVYYYDEEANDGEGGYVPISATDEDLANKLIAANRLLWASTSTAQIFYKGLAFFSVPIRHLGWDKNVDANAPLLTENTTSGRPSVYNWGNLRLGDLGVVRNHVYNLEITAINGLGIGLENETQPMVPPMDPDNYYVAARLNVLQWRIVGKQSVTL